jgi:ribokinase
VPHLPRPGDAVHATAVRRVLGGKGFNQAVAARRLGAEVALAGAIGRNSFGDGFLAALDRHDIDHRHVVRVDAPTGLAMPMVDPSGENTIVVALGANAQPLRVSDTYLEGQGVLLLQGELAPETTLDLAARAAARDLPFILNLAPADRRLEPAIGHANVVVVNEVEEADLGGRSRLAGLGAPVVTTLGERGARVDSVLFPAPVVLAVDTTGAGDAFCAALGVLIAEGADLDEAVRFAVAAGSASCTRPGTSTSMPTRAEVEALLG